MKKIIKLATTGGLAFSLFAVPSTILKTNPISQKTNLSMMGQELIKSKIPEMSKVGSQINWSWNNIGISHKVTVPPTGTHTKSDTQFKSTATAKTSYDELKNQKIALISGKFNLGTHKNPKSLERVNLYLDQPHKIKSNVLTWKSSRDDLDHYASNGWAKQRCTIDLTLEAQENNEGIVEFKLTSWIWTQTQGSVHSPYTESIANSISFLG